MTPLEMLLILIGAGILIFSCFLVEKSTEKRGSFILTDNDVSMRELTTAEITEIKTKIDIIISEVTDETVAKTEDHLSQISNEKIMALNDFSSQVMEKINQNHDEVVFLYNMLNEKESDLKGFMKQVELSKIQFVESDLNEQADTVLMKLNQSDQLTNRIVEETGDNNNQKILDLNTQGKSIIEIAKTLGLGQGEVKLVIDLFKEK